MLKAIFFIPFVLLGHFASSQDIPKDLYGNWRGTVRVRSDGKPYSSKIKTVMQSHNGYHLKISKDGWLTNDDGLREKLQYNKKDSSFFLADRHFVKIERLTPTKMVLRLYLFYDRKAAATITDKSFFHRCYYVKKGA
ncbi:hypothetical protein EGT74_03070 [Chitinophaga lutea]|uniref:Uncharacterized protein n=1 Tax=Chitinophaga lutea TaxID=2488634 RepID=A0A3N4Q975_9BACT|nr:hypothetical protein [Chitinophaga lutea]RPE12550.1 hypothetical protein EGT74_03070 [Chitinophaga lutea]